MIREGLVAACLTALMILLFLGSWRSTVIIAISIPLSVLVSITMLSALHETINLMTLGGLALAVGILVDDATVAIENIERNLAQGKDTVQAILDGSQEIAIPALVSTLCICIVFVPMFFLTGVAKFLFVPLAEAVVFAMLASYVFSRTLVPTMAMYLLKGHHGEEYATGNDIFSRTQRKFAQGFDRLRERYRNALTFCVDHAWTFVSLFLLFCVASLALVPVLGRDFFPSVDAGLIRLHMRARAGQRVEETAREADGVDNLIRRVIPPEDLANILDNIGLFNSTINTTYSNSRRDRGIRRGNPDRPETRAKDADDPLRGRIAAAAGRNISGNAVLFSAGRHGQPDSEFRSSLPHRYSTGGAEHRQELRPGAGDLRANPARARRGGRARAAVALGADAFSGRGPHAGAVGGADAAGRGKQRAAFAEFQLSDQPVVLGESGNRDRIQRGRAGAAIQSELHAVADEYPGGFGEHQHAADSGKPGPSTGERGASAGEPVRYAVAAGRVRIGGRARPGRAWMRTFRPS